VTARSVARAAGALLLLTAGTSHAERPASEQYTLHCSGCHGPDGRGSPPTTPSLHDLAGLLEAPGGRAYLARVPGAAQAPIEDAELAGLLDWILREFSDTTVTPPYTAAEVGALRREPLRDPISARPALGNTAPGTQAPGNKAPGNKAPGNKAP
jgi:mono/diheme cytochrome c family protein